MVLGAYLAKRHIEEIEANAYRKARRQGMNEAYKRVNAEIAAYMRRMKKARDADEPFNEPPPYFPINDEK